MSKERLKKSQSKYLDKREDLESAQRERRREAKAVIPEQVLDDPNEYQQVPFDFDFEIELIKRDEVSVSYILQLIERLNQNPKQHDLTRDMILNVLQTDPDLRHKKPLFQEFIDQKLPTLKASTEQGTEGVVKQQFNAFVREKKKEAIQKTCNKMQADIAGFIGLYDDYVYRSRLPDIKELLSVLANKPKITERKEVAETMRLEMERIANLYESSMT